jgi:ubiquinone/menaquinone biosynthesis C-methylase UbiE
MHPLRRFLRFFFWHFYHGFAWTYDFVAAFVSIGRWNDWIRSALPYIQGRDVLELGHGPGHLQLALRRGGYTAVVGLDESPQMGRLAAKRLRQAGYSDLSLTRGIAQSLPFPAQAFDTVVSTFPAEYIFEPETMLGVRRVLRDGGRFVVLPAAWIVGRKTLDRLAAWLFRATDQVPRIPAPAMAERLRGTLEHAGFTPEFTTVEVRSSQVLVVVATVLK